jgi:hypothetical protein
MARIVPLLCAIGVLAGPFHPGRARAEEVLRQVVIEGEHPAASFSIRDPAGATLVERCHEPCSLTLPSGKLRLEMFDAEGNELGARNVMVNQRTMWTALPHDTTERDLGLGLGVTGVILLAAGSILWLSRLSGHESFHATKTEGQLGALMLLGGAITTPIGAAMFFGNLRPKVAMQLPHRAGR